VAARALRRACLPACAALCALLASGCMTGLVYTHTVRPLDLDLHDTPARLEQKTARPSDSWKSLRIPFVPYAGDLRFDWGDDSIRRAIEDAGIERVHYADVETLSVLLVWTQRTVHVYGE